MVNPGHLAKLQEGVAAWNKWRKENPYIKPDLIFAHLIGANLIGANLIGANLIGANLRDANLNLTKLDRRTLEYAICEGVKLEEIDLSGANLEEIKLSAFNLSGFNFFNANLYGANLNKVQALGTNFEGATLTGACIEDWNINSQTNLQNVRCDYIYLKATYSETEKKFIFVDRVPHDPDKIFAPREFSKRYQKILETVNLYFEEGIDWRAFLVSFNKLQIECNRDELSINSFENKGNGAFVIKVNVPEGANKAEIEKYLKKQYQLEATVEAQQRELTNLYEITKLLASRPINVNNQSGNFGMGSNQGNITDNSQVSGVNNEPTQQDRNQ